MINKSEEINELAKALAVAQGQMGGAKKDSVNPFFRSNYADLASVWESIRKPLSDNGLSIVQTTEENLVITILMHSSGQWISGKLAIKSKDESPQAMGSAITYARRYALAAIVGVYQEDDDGNKAQAQDRPQPTPVAQKQPQAQAKPVAPKPTEQKQTAHTEFPGPEDTIAFWRLVKDLKIETNTVFANMKQLTGKQYLKDLNKSEYTLVVNHLKSAALADKMEY